MLQKIIIQVVKRLAVVNMPSLAGSTFPCLGSGAETCIHEFEGHTFMGRDTM